MMQDLPSLINILEHYAHTPLVKDHVTSPKHTLFCILRILWGRPLSKVNIQILPPISAVCTHLMHRALEHNGLWPWLNWSAHNKIKFEQNR